MSTHAHTNSTLGKLPRGYTVAEVSCLLDLSPGAVLHRVREGRLRAYIETWRFRVPGMPVAYRRRTLRIRGAEIERYQQVLEDEYAARRARRKPTQPDALREYNRTAQIRSRARRRAAGEPWSSITGRARKRRVTWSWAARQGESGGSRGLSPSEVGQSPKAAASVEIGGTVPLKECE